MLRNPEIERRLKAHTGNQVQELKSRARITVHRVIINVKQDTEAPQDFTISVIEKGKKIYLMEMTADKFPTQVLKCARKRAQVWTPLDKETLNDIFRNQLPKDRARRREAARREEAEAEAEVEASTDINTVENQNVANQELGDLVEDWYVSKEDFWHLLLDKELPSIPPDQTDEDRASKLGVSIKSCMKLRVMKNSLDTECQLYGKRNRPSPNFLYERRRRN